MHFMKRMVFLLFLLPVLCQAQSYKLSALEENRVDESTHDAVARTYWHVFSRGTMRDPLSISYRISRINNEYFLDIKMMDAGDKIIVAKNEPLELLQNDEERITLYNAEYAASCRGCGARTYTGNDAPGIMLSYPFHKADIVQLKRSYIKKIKLHSEEGYWFKKVNEQNSEIFLNQLNLVLNAFIK
ncbi:MAG: hypothetical protein JWQ38_2389 [Flavipsychrobacter sp.]|nr:hypothetical protein [Flavipsychrobacter sp.]